MEGERNKQGWLRDQTFGRAANRWPGADGMPHAMLILVVTPARQNCLRECAIIVALFLSTFEKQIDKKGRVSVPAPFRAALGGQNFNGIIAYASFVNGCIEACGMDRLEQLYAQIDALDPFSEERAAFETAIMGGSVQLGFDGEGRVVLPQNLIEGAAIDGKCIFVGKGKTFEIWQPEAFASYQDGARKLAMEKRTSLRAETPKGGAA